MIEQKEIEIHLPNVLGSEKLAMEEAASLARKMGFSEDRVQDLKTAVAEACLNAMEHGNRMDNSTTVSVVLKPGRSSLEVAVRDEGEGIGPLKEPSLEEKMGSGDRRKRGWGIFLIRQLMDEVRFHRTEPKGNVVRMIVHLDK